MNRFTITAITIGSVLAIVLGLGPVFTSEAEVANATEREIDFFSGRLETQPEDVVSATRLGVAFRQLQRETSEISHLYMAEDVLRKALGMLPGYPPTELALARVMIDLHRFEEGLTLARSSNESDPQDEAVLAIGDALLAIGDYDLAEQTYAELGDGDVSPALGARLARIAELRGDLQLAVELMETARSKVSDASPVGESIAWFSTRLADLYLSSGRIAEAEDMLRHALAALPDYAPAVAGLGDVAMTRRDLEGAIAQFERASELATDPAWLFALADLNSLLGREEVARDYVAAALETIDQFESIHPRDFAIHYARTSRPDLALKYARQALEQSQDIYAHDVMAFALYSADRHEEAWVHMEQALALGTNEAVFHLHAGAILAELGDLDRARGHLKRALAIGLDPWDQTWAEEQLDSVEIES